MSSFRAGAPRAKSDFARIESIIHFLVRHAGREHPDLGALAREAGLSESHFHRLFKKWAGVTPKQFLETIVAKQAKARLEASRSVLDAALESGLSSPSRLHDLMVVLEGMTPGEYKRMGQGVRVRYGVHETVYGSMLIALTERGICKLVFFAGDDRAARAEVLAVLPRCEAVRDDRATRTALRDAGLLQGSGRAGGKRVPLRLCVQGTAFQIKVWQALLSVPEGSLVSYRQLARAIGAPGAARAVGNAVGSNPIAVLIPCHRVIRESGVLHSYRWGEERKKVLLGRELSRL